MKAKVDGHEYIDRHKIHLELMREMWEDPKVQCYDDRKLPSKTALRDGSAFFAGPTSRSYVLEYNWRSVLRKLVRERGYKGWIYVPEPRGSKEADFFHGSYAHNWESKRLLSADSKIFWVPRKGTEMLGLNTNFEWGLIVGMLLSGKPVRLCMGWPDDAERVGLPNHYAELAGVTRYKTLNSLCAAFLNLDD